MKHGENLTGEQLTELVQKHISNEGLDAAFKEPIFREFARICLFFQMTATLFPNQKQEFGHFFEIRNQETNKKCNVEFKIIVSSLEI